MISDKRKKQLQHEKEFKSFRNKMGSNIVWFDSLSKTKQWDLLFAWKKLKSKNKLTKPEWTIVPKRVPVDPLRPWGRARVTKVNQLKYPPSLRHFILECKSSGQFLPMVTKVRETTIDMILNNK